MKTRKRRDELDDVHTAREGERVNVQVPDVRRVFLEATQSGVAK